MRPLSLRTTTFFLVYHIVGPPARTVESYSARCSVFGGVRSHDALCARTPRRIRSFCNACSEDSSVARPIVTVKIALDANGAVDDLSVVSKRFTSPESLDAVHRLRRDSCAVLVGVGTVIRDDPSLTVRRVPLLPGQAQPVRQVPSS